MFLILRWGGRNANCELAKRDSEKTPAALMTTGASIIFAMSIAGSRTTDPRSRRVSYQSNRTVRLIIRGAIVPAARPSPVAVYLPVLAFEFTELFVPVNVNDAFMLVNCTSLNTLNAWSCSLTPLFFRPANVTGNRRESVMSHSCQVG